jgi:hypothetical protein
MQPKAHAKPEIRVRFEGMQGVLSSEHAHLFECREKVTKPVWKQLPNGKRVKDFKKTIESIPVYTPHSNSASDIW